MSPTCSIRIILYNSLHQAISTRTRLVYTFSFVDTSSHTSWVLSLAPPHGSQTCCKWGLNFLDFLPVQSILLLLTSSFVGEPEQPGRLEQTCTWSWKFKRWIRSQSCDKDFTGRHLTCDCRLRQSSFDSVLHGGFCSSHFFLRRTYLQILCTGWSW